MTIVACVLVPEGIVLATDSRQVIDSGRGQLRIVSDNAIKIFQINENLGGCALQQSTFYSNGVQSPNTIQTEIQLAASNLPHDCSVEQAALHLHKEIKCVLEKHQTVTKTENAKVTFFLAGYRNLESAGQLYRCDIPGGVKLERETIDSGMVWSGQREIIDRLILGWEPRLFKIQSTSNNEDKKLLWGQRQKLHLHINFQTMPLQDALDLAACLVQTTIDLQRLSDGITGMPGLFPTCGGIVQMAVITPQNGFRWINKIDLKIPSKSYMRKEAIANT